MPLAEDYKALKKTWKTATKNKKNFPKAFADALATEKWKADGGHFSIEKKLKSMEKGKTLKKRQLAWIPLKKSIFDDQKTIRRLLNVTDIKSSAHAKSLLKKTEASLGDIFRDGEALVQPPKRGNRKKMKLLYKRKAAGDLKSKWLDVGSFDIQADLIIDDELARLEKEGELGFHWINLQKDCQKEVKKTMGIFRKTIKDLDKKLEKMSPDDRKAKVKEANEVIRYYTKIVESNVNAVVDQYWERHKKRCEYLSAFKKEVAVDITISTATIAVSTTAMAASLGTSTVLSSIAIAKAVLDIALSIKKLRRSTKSLKKKLIPAMSTIESTWNKRQKALKSGEGQKAAKAKEVLKEGAASALGQVSAELFTTTSRTKKEAEEYAGKLTEQEREAGRLYKEISKYTSNFPTAPEGEDARTSKQLVKIHRQFMIMQEEYNTFSAELTEDIRFAESAIDICTNLQDEDYVPKWTKSAGTVTKSLFGVAAAAQVIVKLAV
ncbi:MAG: hypothetical protein P8R54_21950 [Myxococcota bacterium]|nr:hypothetical protein [Myxococcota bacterium]